MKRMLGVGLIAVVLVLLGAPLQPSGAGRLEASLFDLLHYPAGMLVAWGTVLVLPGRPRLALGLGVAVLIAVEIVQPVLGRERAWIDVGLGVLGVLVVGGRELPVRRRRLLWLALTVGAVLPSTLYALDRRAMMAAFPVLADFESAVQAGRWVANGGEAEIVETPSRRRALEFAVDGSRDFPGVFLEELVGDWSGYDELHVWVHLEAPARRSLIIRADDTEEDAPGALRGEVEWPLMPGMSRIELPLEGLLKAEARGLDPARIRRLGFFFVEVHEGERLTLDDVQLVRGRDASSHSE